MRRLPSPPETRNTIKSSSNFAPKAATPVCVSSTSYTANYRLFLYMVNFARRRQAFVSGGGERPDIHNAFFRIVAAFIFMPFVILRKGYGYRRRITSAFLLT
ncbi:hypothetical protein EVAR_78203_1 [Eumeta japonica]|uniref:Uncharacterized protein n=1 Tax=Eumeta variegata TaxID=151549 RepID=A0A4C2A320_EUMVA|nr:hypothetical protein EVAR_78203_1 [Eumeta japonica]